MLAFPHWAEPGCSLILLQETDQWEKWPRITLLTKPINLLTSASITLTTSVALVATYHEVRSVLALADTATARTAKASILFAYALSCVVFIKSR